MLALRNCVALALATALACGPSPRGERPLPPPTPPDPGPDAGLREVVDEGEPTLDELRMGAIAKAVNDTMAEWHQCWAVGAADDFRVSGRVVVEVKFDADGNAASTSVVDDETGDRRLTECLVAIYEKYDWPPVFNDSASARFPFSFEPAQAQYSVRGRHVVPAQLAGGKLSAQVMLDAKNTGNPSIGLSRLVLRDGLDVKAHLHSAAEILYVVRGRGVAYDHRGSKQGVAVKAHDVIYAPAGSAHGFLQTGDEETVLLSLYAPGGAEQRFKGGEDPGTQPYTRKMRKKRMPKVLTRSVEAGEPYTIAGGHGKVHFGFDAGTAKDNAAYVGRIHLAKGLKMPYHEHDTETEVLFLLEGEGTLTVKGVAYPVAAGDAIQLPPKVMHNFEVSGKGAVTAVQFYSPSGPEQRFKGKKGE